MAKIQEDILGSLATEVLVQIFVEVGYHSQASLASLALACKHLYSVWDFNKVSILRSVTERNVPAFDDALLTIRVTAIVESYINQSHKRLEDFLDYSENTPVLNTIPKPEINLSALSSKAKRPTLEELISVQDLYTLISCAISLGTSEDEAHRRELLRHVDYPPIVQCGHPYMIEVDIFPDIEGNENIDQDYLWNRFRNYSRFSSSWTENKNDMKKDLEIRRYRVYSSFYRVFLAGAMLAPAYLEPFFTGHERTTRLLWGTEARLRWSTEDSFRAMTRKARASFVGGAAHNHRGGVSGTLEQENEYLNKYIPYNIQNSSPEAIKSVFGPLLDHLLESGRNNILLDPWTIAESEIPLAQGSSESGDKLREISALHQVLMLFLAQDILRWLFANADPKENGRCGRIALSKELYTSFCQKEGVFKNYRNLRLIFYGIYELEDIYFPGAASEASGASWLLAQGAFEVGREMEGKYKRRLLFDLYRTLRSRHKHGRWGDRGDEDNYWIEAKFFCWAVRNSPGHRKLRELLFGYPNINMKPRWYDADLFGNMWECYKQLTDDADNE